jgi:hypothetical protein
MHKRLVEDAFMFFVSSSKTKPPDTQYIDYEITGACSERHDHVALPTTRSAQLRRALAASASRALPHFLLPRLQDCSFVCFPLLLVPTSQRQSHRQKDLTYRSNAALEAVFRKMMIEEIMLRLTE